MSELNREIPEPLADQSLSALILELSEREEMGCSGHCTCPVDNCNVVDW